MVKLRDLAEDWLDATGYPIPLGLDMIRRDVPDDVAVAFTEALAQSILHAYENMDDASAYAQEFGRGINDALNRQFVQMYVNVDTLLLGEDCRASLKELYSRAQARGLLESVPPFDFVTPGDPAVIDRINAFIRNAATG